MKEILELMTATFQSCKENGSYFLFYILALGLGLAVAWDRYGKTELEDNWMVEEGKKQIQLWPFLYGLLALFLVVANPLFVWILDKVAPVTNRYHKLWLLLMLLFLCAYGMVCFLNILRENRQKVTLILGFVFLIALAGSSFGILSGRYEAADYKEAEEILAYVKDKGEDTVLLAEEAILEYAGIYEPQVRVLYGKDLYTTGLDMGILDTYDSQLAGLYEIMKNPEKHMGDISNTAFMFDCDVIVLKKFENAPDKAGIYYKREATKNYLIYGK